METNENKELKVNNGGVSPQQIEGWKNRHRRVYEVEVKDPETNEVFKGYFKRPDMKTLEASNALNKQNEVKASLVLFDNCWLGGAPELKEDALYQMEAIAAMSGIFSKCVHSLKNL